MKKREPDEAHKWTDRKLEDIEKELHDIYKEAQDDLQKKWDEALEILDKKASKFREEYEALKKEGKKKEARAKLKEYQQALNKAKSENHYRTMLEQISSDLTRVNERALAYINNQLPQVYLKNYNYIGKAVEDEMEGHSFNMSFNLVNEHAVKELYKKMPQKVVKVAKDRAWNNKHINSQLMQGILQGESIPKISERFKNVVGMDERASVREARTLTTQAENLGRLESLKSLDSDYGVISMKMWIATADDHTRASHLDLDGETADLGEKFSNGLMFPADPDGEPAEVYNCRCAMEKVITGFRNLDGTITPFEYEDERRELHRNAIEAEKKKRGLLDKGPTSSERQEPKITGVKDFDEHTQKVLYDYTNGKYTEVCEYSQYLANGDNDIAPTMHRMTKKEWEEKELPEISQQAREDTKRIYDAILNQDVSNEPLVRLERGAVDAEEGDVMRLGVRSASQDKDFVEKLVKEEIEGFDYDFYGKHNNGDWTEYRFISSKGLDLSEISAYPAQKETIVAGSYKVKSVEVIDAVKRRTIEERIPVSEGAKNVSYFTSKKGTEMVKYEYEGKQMTEPVKQFKNRTVTRFKEIAPVFGRKVVTLEVD